MTTRADVVRVATKRLGDRWCHQASLGGVASDCYGLITSVGIELSVKEASLWASDPALRGYGRNPNSKVLIAACEKYLDPVPIEEAGLGDLLAMRWEKEPKHFAIISRLNPMYVIHAYASARKVAENNIADRWREGITWSSLIVSVWRYRGVS